MALLETNPTIRSIGIFVYYIFEGFIENLEAFPSFIGQMAFLLISYTYGSIALQFMRDNDLLLNKQDESCLTAA